MVNVKVSIPYGSTHLTVSFPDNISVKLLIPRNVPGLRDPRVRIREALKKPIGSKPLSEIISSRDIRKAVIIISDLTRPVPDNIILPEILRELNSSGIGKDKITIVVATGAHTPPSFEEIKNRIGEEVVRNVSKIEIHNAKDKSNLIYIGETSFGNKIYINKTVFEADLKIATGCIRPHIIAGYSGGRKIILPGVAGEETISYNHFKFLTHPKVRPGEIEENPISKDMEEAAKLAGLDFIVNVILNTENEVYKVVAGDPYIAWREGVRIADKIYRVSLESPVDILIVSPGEYPEDINLYQSLSKAVNPLWYVVKDGGVVILVAECRDGVGDSLMEEWLVKASSPEEVVERGLREGLKLGPHVGWFTCYRVLSRARFIVVSSIERHKIEQMLFTYASNMDEALKLALKYVKGKPEIAVVPYASKTIINVKGH